MNVRATSEEGYSLVEFLVAMVAGVTVLLALFAMFDLAGRNSLKVAQRADANGRAKPVLQELLRALESSCSGPAIAPVIAGSTNTELRFQTATGNAVAPTPQKRIVTLQGTTLTQRTYPATGGANPIWTYATNPSSTRTLLEGVSVPASSIGPVFSYYAAQGGEILPTPLPTPLSATDAARTVEVKVALKVDPADPTVKDPNASVTLTDAALFRFSPFSEDPTKVNGPCA